MISKEEIKKLADLARIEIENEEQEGLAKEIDQILEYVGQVKPVAESPLSSGERVEGGVVNVVREDANPTESETCSKELIAEFPEREEDYLKVKKIL